MAKKLLDQMSDAIRIKHYSYRTEETYLDSVRRYILFHQKRHPKDIYGRSRNPGFPGAHLATSRNVSQQFSIELRSLRDITLRGFTVSLKTDY